MIHLFYVFLSLHTSFVVAYAKFQSVEKCVFKFVSESASCNNAVLLQDISDEFRPGWKHIKIVNPFGNFSLVDGNINHLGYVETFDLTNTGNVDIPDTGFQYFTALKSLNLTNSSIISIGDNWFGADGNIIELNLSYNKIMTLRRQQFRNLSKMRYLNLIGNSLSCVEQGAFQDIPYLEDLNISNNRLQKLVNLGQLGRLRSLNIGKNSLNEIPSTTLHSMDELTNLSLEENVISVIHEGAFIGVDNLRELNLSVNDIHEIPANTFSMKLLRVLDLSNNKLNSIQSYAFKDLRALVNLNLSKNALTKLDDKTFVGLSSLNWLLLSENYILTIQPNTFAHLQSIYRIDLVLNSLETLSGNMFGENKLPLKKLFIQKNNIENIEPRAFVSVPNVDFLSLSRNRIKRLDDNLFEPLRNLKKLHLQDNYIAELPENVFSDISRVIELQIQYNKLSFLPTSPSVFSNLEKITVEGNPWQCACLREIFDFITASSQRRRIDSGRKNNPFFLGAKPLCYEPPVDSPAICVRDINFVQKYFVVELYDDALRGRAH